jgi:hypothetical protein
MATRHYCDGCGEEIKFSSYPSYLIEINVIPQNSYAPPPAAGVYSTYDVHVNPPDVGGLYHSHCVTICSDIEDEESTFIEDVDVVPVRSSHEAWDQFMTNQTPDQTRMVVSEFIEGAIEGMEE